MKYLAERPYSSDQDIIAHDHWLINLWQRTIDKSDKIYFAGDLTLYKRNEARRLLERLPGEKYLAEGNHDASIKAHSNYFQKVAQIMEITIKSSVFSFLKEDLKIVMCHYPLLDLSGKHQGTIMLQGHCHGNLDECIGKYVSQEKSLSLEGQNEDDMANKSKDDQIRELKAQLRQARKEAELEKLRAHAYDTMINLAEETFNIPIRKKSGTKQ